MATTESAAEGFTRTAADYDDVVRHNIAGAERLVMSLPPGEYPRVLDVGCGTGWSAEAMIERRGATHVTGVDPSEGMLDRFRVKLAAHPAVAFDLLSQDVMGMTVPDAAFDAVISSMAFHWFPDKQGAMSRMARAVRPGGVLGVLCSGRGGEQAFRDVLARMDPPVPAVWIAAFDWVQRDQDEMGAYLLGAGLDPLDIWIERRHRTAEVDAYLSRIQTVASHLSSGIPQDELDALAGRVEAAVRAAAGPDGLFEYEFAKLYAVARRPG